MVKRCCAKSCFNSQLTHKIGYFGFPKNEVVYAVHKYSKKNIKLNLINFFSAKEWAKLAGRDDLLDKKIDNLTKYYLCSDHFTPQDFSNPNIEDRSFLMLNRTANIVPLPTQFENNLQQNYEIALKNSEKFINYSKKEGTERSPRGRKRKLEDVTGHDDFDLSDTNIEFIEEIDNLCRLCARSESEMVPIFSDNGELTTEALSIKIMPECVIQFNDGLPQQACITCLEKLQSCVNIIDGFVVNQNLFLS
jgi:Zinc-finger associated domain (zf-AD)/THAP domain